MSAQADYLDFYRGNYGAFTPITKGAPSMDLTIDRAALVGALRAARVAVATRTSLPILEYCHLAATPDGGLVLSATNLEIGLTTTVGADVAQAGACCIPATLALALLSQCPGDRLTLTLDKARLRVAGGGAKLALPTLDVEDFPVLPGERPDAAATSYGETTVADFAAALSRVAYAAQAKPENRRAFMGVCLRPVAGGVSLECTDSYSVASTTLALAAPLANARPLIVPARPLAELLGVLPDGPLTLAIVGNALRLSTTTTTGYAVTLDGAFPDFASLIPRNEQYAHVFALHRADLTAAVKFVRAAETDGALSLDFGPRGLTLAARDPELATIGLPLSVPGAPVAVRLDPARVLAALGVGDGETVTIGINDGNKVVALRPQGGAATTHAIMPLIGGAQ